MSIFAPNEYASTRKRLAQASTLPPSAYTSPDWYQREVETIFRQNWLMAAREDEIPDYVLDRVLDGAIERRVGPS